MKLSQLQEARYAHGNGIVDNIKSMFDRIRDAEFGTPIRADVEEPFDDAFVELQRQLGPPRRVEKAEGDDHWSNRPDGQIIRVSWELDKPKMLIIIINRIDSYHLEIKNLDES